MSGPNTNQHTLVQDSSLREEKQQRQFQLAKQQLEERYDIRETLGEGAFSEVKKAVCRETGQSVAIKIIDRQKCLGKEYLIDSEIQILKRVKHDHIIQLYELYETEHRIYLVMQLVTGGELFDAIVEKGFFSEQESAHIIRTVLEAIAYLHGMGIAHRDLKPENLLFSSRGETPMKIMLGDFGLSKIFNEEEVMKTACGTPGYVAPEVLRRQGYGPEVDMWSLGVVAYILYVLSQPFDFLHLQRLCGYPPFYDPDNQKLYQQILEGRFQFDSPSWDGVSAQAKHFISCLLVVEPRLRLTAVQALQHPFLLQYTPALPQPQPQPQPQAAAAVVAPAPVVLQSLPTPIEKPLPTPIERVAVANEVRQRGATNASRRHSLDARRPVPHPPTTPRAAAAPPLLEQPSHPLSTVQQTPSSLSTKCSGNGSDSGIFCSPLGSEEAMSSTKQQTEQQQQQQTEQQSTPSDQEITQQWQQDVQRVRQWMDEGRWVEAYLLLHALPHCPDSIRLELEQLLFTAAPTHGMQVKQTDNDKEEMKQQQQQRLEKVFQATPPSFNVPPPPPVLRAVPATVQAIVVAQEEQEEAGARWKDWLKKTLLPYTQ